MVTKKEDSELEKRVALLEEKVAILGSATAHTLFPDEEPFHDDKTSGEGPA